MRNVCRHIVSETIILVMFYSSLHYLQTPMAQSIGYQPQFNLGFNPYTSPIFGYGLGLPYGAYNTSPTRFSWLTYNTPIAPYTDKHGFISKIHARAFLKKLASSQVLSSRYYGLKDRFHLLMNPQYAFTPYGAGYGYGKHYGSAVIPNNPYKSTYGDYYDNSDLSISKQGELAAAAGSLKHKQLPIGGRLPEGSIELNTPTLNTGHHKEYLKPIIKTGALLTTAALLGKKILESPLRLNPSGMILSEIRP